MSSALRAKYGHPSMILVDTHALIFDALAPHRLTAKAKRAANRAREAGEIFCSDISLWEIAMLASRKRIQIAGEAIECIHDIVQASRLTVVPISPEIAVMAQSGKFSHGDPADRLIASTALIHGWDPVTADEHLYTVPLLKTIW